MEKQRAASWLGGLEAITDGLGDSKVLVLAGAKLAEQRDDNLLQTPLHLFASLSLIDA